jgi:hypothetical protein
VPNFGKSQYDNLRIVHEKGAFGGASWTVRGQYKVYHFRVAKGTREAPDIRMIGTREVTVAGATGLDLEGQ